MKFDVLIADVFIAISLGAVLGGGERLVDIDVFIATSLGAVLGGGGGARPGDDAGGVCAPPPRARARAFARRCCCRLMWRWVGGVWRASAAAD